MWKNTYVKSQKSKPPQQIKSAHQLRYHKFTPTAFKQKSIDVSQSNSLNHRGTRTISNATFQQYSSSSLKSNQKRAEDNKIILLKKQEQLEQISKQLDCSINFKNEEMKINDSKRNDNQKGDRRLSFVHKNIEHNEIRNKSLRELEEQLDSMERNEGHEKQLKERILGIKRKFGTYMRLIQQKMSEQFEKMIQIMVNCHKTIKQSDLGIKQVGLIRLSQNYLKQITHSIDAAKKLKTDLSSETHRIIRMVEEIDKTDVFDSSQRLENANVNKSRRQRENNIVVKFPDNLQKLSQGIDSSQGGRILVLKHTQSRQFQENYSKKLQKNNLFHSQQLTKVPHNKLYANSQKKIRKNNFKMHESETQILSQQQKTQNLSNKPLRQERKQLSQKMKDFERVLTNIRDMIHIRNPQ